MTATLRLLNLSSWCPDKESLSSICTTSFNWPRTLFQAITLFMGYLQSIGSVFYWLWHFKQKANLVSRVWATPNRGIFYLSSSWTKTGKFVLLLFFNINLIELFLECLVQWFRLEWSPAFCMDLSHWLVDMLVTYAEMATWTVWIQHICFQNVKKLIGHATSTSVVQMDIFVKLSVFILLFASNVSSFCWFVWLIAVIFRLWSSSLVKVMLNSINSM